ncbi:MAG: hypothetical protein V9H26_07460 [Verrucomicrobiota bacterium]
MSAHPKKPLLPRRVFALRVLRSLALALGIISLSLALGILGYHYCAGLAWVDALLNASMILTGMGPVNELTYGRRQAVCLRLCPVQRGRFHHLGGRAARARGEPFPP